MSVALIAAAKKCMKFFIAILVLILFVSCSGNKNNNPSPSINNAAAANPKSEKNKEISLKNEVVQATQTAQDIEKRGRQMESYRLAVDTESARQCAAVKENLQREIKDLELKINNFPRPFNDSLKPSVADLNGCVSCSKTTAMASCVKARASINEAIKQMFR